MSQRAPARWACAGALFGTLAIATVAMADTGSTPRRPRLVVCVDPNNLPFSNRTGGGFENKLAQLLADDMGARIEYLWWVQRRGYVRKTLNAARCDLWPGIASGIDSVTTTAPYYTSSYMFVTRLDRHISGLTLDDPRLRSLSIGVQMIGHDAANTPPAHAMSRRGIIDNVHGFMVYGSLTRPQESSAIIDAVAGGKIDVALVWGPSAGYFASRSTTPLYLEPVTPRIDGPGWPMVYSISVGVRHGDTDLQRRIDSILGRERPRVEKLLQAYHIPQVAPASAQPALAAAASDTGRAEAR